MKKGSFSYWINQDESDRAKELYKWICEKERERFNEHTCKEYINRVNKFIEFYKPTKDRDYKPFYDGLVKEFRRLEDIYHRSGKFHAIESNLGVRVYIHGIATGGAYGHV